MDNTNTNKDTNKIIEAINKALNKQRMHYKEIYEQLIADKVIPPNSEKEFKNLYAWALEMGYVDKMRIKSWSKKRGKLPKYFTKKQLIQLFEVIDRPKDMIAFFMALMCGLRINELCKLRIRDIDFDNHRVFIGDSKNPNRTRDNYGKDRYVDFDPAIEGVLKKWIEIIGESSEWFMPSDKSPDMHLRKKSLHERLRLYLKEAGILQIDYTMKVSQRINGKRITKTVNRYTRYFHCFRHTMACIIYNKTSDIYVVNKFLGHADVDTTAVYAKVIDSKMKTTISSVFNSLHYNYHNGEHLPNPNPIKSTLTQSSPVVETIANSPLDLLGLQLVNNEISQDEYIRKRKLLESEGYKQIIEIKDTSDKNKDRRR